MPIFLKIKYPTQKLTPFITIGPRLDYLANVSKGKFKFSSMKFTDGFADYPIYMILSNHQKDL